MHSPYSGLPPRAFWKPGVVEADPLVPAEIYRPKFGLTRDDRIFTAGSCFAQHVSVALRHAGCTVVETEPAPPFTPDAVARQFGYGLYSARFGNIYSVRQLRQLIEEAAGEFDPAEPIWEREGRYFDALRPGVEPGGLTSREAVVQMRDQHLASVAQALGEAEVVMFTLGLTEAWEHRASGTIYPTAPGTIAGNFDDKIYGLRNFSYDEVLEDFRTVKTYLTRLNPAMRFLLTVSPVPLTATAGGGHVLTATAHSKSVLRAAAGTLAGEDSAVDYFPAYEMVMNPALKGAAFAENLRSVRPALVAAIMRIFLDAHGLVVEGIPEPAPPDFEPECEDALLEAFSR